MRPKNKKLFRNCINTQIKMMMMHTYREIEKRKHSRRIS